MSRGPKTKSSVCAAIMYVWKQTRKNDSNWLIAISVPSWQCKQLQWLHIWFCPPALGKWWRDNNGDKNIYFSGWLSTIVTWVLSGTCPVLALAPPSSSQSSFLSVLARSEKRKVRGCSRILSFHWGTKSLPTPNYNGDKYYWATHVYRDCRIVDNDWSGGSSSRFSACKKD